MRISQTKVLTRKEAKEQGIGRKEWKRFFKKIGKMKYKNLHTKVTQSKAEMLRR
jgi:hypothetical protein